MRAVVQRVDKAIVEVNDRIVSDISKGMLVFLGIEKGDDFSDADFLLEKVINLRIFEDEEGKMNRSLSDISGEMLVVSQFTLLGDCRKGRRPSFTSAEDPNGQIFFIRISLIRHRNGSLWSSQEYFRR